MDLIHGRSAPVKKLGGHSIRLGTDKFEVDDRSIPYVEFWDALIFSKKNHDAYLGFLSES